MLTNRRGRKPVSGSDPTPERVLQSNGYFEESNDVTRAKILTFRDDGLEQSFLDAVIDSARLDAGRKYRYHWFYGGLAGNVPAMGAGSIVVGGDAFGGMPRSEFERIHRLEYRRAVQHVGIIHSRIIENVACWGHKLEVIELGWPGAEANLRDGLKKLARYWGWA